MKFETVAQIPSFEELLMKVPFHDFIQNMSQAPSKWIKVNKSDYFKKESQHLKNSF